jgi:hypothetical protein
MNRSDSLPFQGARLTRAIPTAGGVQPSGPQPAAGISFDALVHLGRQLTRQIALAESRGDLRKVERLLHKKDQLHLLRRELSNVSR